MPSPSSSLSVTSGVPSPSLSLWIVTVISLVDLLPASSTAFTVAVTVFSSLSPQSSAFGTVPSICFVSGLYFKPSGRFSTVTFAFSSSVVTGTGVISLPSTAVTLSAVMTGAVVSFAATLIVAVALSVVPSEYFTTTGIFTAFPASPSTGV